MLDRIGGGAMSDRRTGIPLGDGIDEIHFRLTCAVCGEDMERAEKHDAPGRMGYVCNGPHPSVPVQLCVKLYSDGQDPVEA